MNVVFLITDKIAGLQQMDSASSNFLDCYFVF
jgi:hypothetical protein